jgi:YbgC/YbaW family acyl-CoA thioester hydrolase
MSHPETLPNPARIVLRRRIEWIDTDAAGIYHYTTAFRLMEAAEAALHTALGCEDVTFGATPRVEVAARFRSPLVFNDPVDVNLTVTALGRTSVCYTYTITKADGTLAVEGEVTAVLIDRRTRRSTPWPQDVRDALATGGPQDGADTA